MPLEPAEMPWRRLYATPEFVEWLDTVVPELEQNTLYDDLRPIEQISALFAEYVAGDSFSNDRRFKKLNWTPDLCVWELKTTDVRIFGWVPERDSFVCCYGDSSDKIKTLDLYGRYMALTRRKMEDVGLDPPICVESSEYSDVISDQDKF